MLLHRFEIGKLYSFIDMLLILLFVSLALINPPEQDGKIVPRADGMLTVEWSADKNVDIDTWVRLADKNVISFTNKNVALGVLRRDDLGDEYYSTGTRPAVLVKQNLEVVDFQKLIDGVYYVNLHYYHEKQSLDPVEVLVELYVMEPYYKVASRIMSLSHRGEERTVFSFTVKDGKVIDVDLDASMFMARKNK